MLTITILEDEKISTISNTFGDTNRRKKWGDEKFNISALTQSDLQIKKPLDLDQKSPHKAPGETFAN